MKLHWTEGNRVTLLENGEEYYPDVFAAIAAAREEVLLETFIWFDDKVGRQLRGALLQAAANGAEVHVLFDGWGSPDLSEAFTGELVAAGVKLRTFEPVRRFLGARWNLLRRMHRKLVVVDRRRAWVGGINYSLDHLAEFGPEAKQDYAARVEGPLVAQIHAFCRASLETPQPGRAAWLRRLHRPRRGAQRQGAVAAGAAAPDSLQPPGSALAAFVTRDNAQHRADIETEYRKAIRLARQRIVIANAYFFPGYRLLKDLRRAARRGVRVDLVLQGMPDMPIVKIAGSMLYAHLIRAGVRIHEYCQRPLHGKIACVDDRWATVGSSNLDPASLGLNLEANVLVADSAFAAGMRARLDALIEESCQRVTLPPASALGSAWQQLRSFVVFHLLRRLPRWLTLLPEQAPTVAPVTAPGGAAAAGSAAVAGTAAAAEPAVQAQGGPAR
ncbi:MAG: cardiolipin synthase ClsB [Rubrivivax sp.]|nr:cardiolipin synthase ClsB [Rubrivivax sp.]